MPLAPIKEFCIAAAGKALLRAPMASGLPALCDRAGSGLSSAGAREPSGQKGQILVYHRVLPRADRFSIDPVATDAFREQMRLLRDRFRPVPLDEMVAAWNQGRTLPGAIAVTFDDGYRDNYANAFPILREFGIPATIFLATDFIGTGAVPWHDRVLRSFRNAAAPSLAWSEAGIAETPLADEGRRSKLAFDILRWLKGFAPEERERHIAALENLLSPLPADPEALMLDWREVREMRAQGVTFGAHTRSHPILSRLATDRLEEEILGSKTIIEGEIGEPVTLFAYPNGQPGDYDERCKSVLQKGGFSCAVTTSHGVNTARQDRFELLRRHVWEPDAGGFYFRLLLERFLA